jgi:hypothetical protein
LKKLHTPAYLFLSTSYRLLSISLSLVFSLSLSIFLSLSKSLPNSLASSQFLPSLPPSLPPLPVSQVGDVASNTRIQQLELELSTMKEATSLLQCDLHSRISDLESSLQVAREDLDGAKASSDGDCRYVICTEEKRRVLFFVHTRYSFIMRALNPLISPPHPLTPYFYDHIPYLTPSLTPSFPTFVFSISLVLSPTLCPI